MDNNIPVEFIFHPTEEELVGHYLKRKLEGDNASVINIIPEIVLCSVEPEDIPARTLIKTLEPEWYFFSPIEYKNGGNSGRMKRETERGFWKSSGNTTYIFKKTDTNKVIGIRKYFRFYEGHSRKNESKTNWAMYEYHAADTSDDAHQKKFVLCRLMNTAEKKTRRGTDALTFDKGDPSRHMASDCKDKAAEEGITDVDGLFPEVNTDSIVPTWHRDQSYNANSRNENSTDAFGSFPKTNVDPIFDEIMSLAEAKLPSHNAYFRNENSSGPVSVELTEEQHQHLKSMFPDEKFVFPELPSHNANFRNENSSRQVSVKLNEEEYEYLKSTFPDGKVVFTQKRRNAFVKGSTQPESLRIYYESSDTDAEVVSARCFNIVDTLTVRDEHPSSGEYHASKMYKSSHGVKASSCDSTADKALKINCIGKSGSLSPRRWKYQYHTKPFISQRAAARFQYQPPRKLSGNAVSNLEARKPSSCTRKMKKPEKDHVIARNSSSKNNSETRNHQSSNVNREGSFICQETASSSQSLFLLLANIVLGILLFTVISLELLSY